MPTHIAKKGNGYTVEDEGSEKVHSKEPMTHENAEKQNAILNDADHFKKTGHHFLPPLANRK